MGRRGSGTRRERISNGAGALALQRRPLSRQPRPATAAAPTSRPIIPAVIRDWTCPVKEGADRVPNEASDQQQTEGEQDLTSPWSEYPWSAHRRSSSGLTARPVYPVVRHQHPLRALSGGERPKSCHSGPNDLPSAQSRSNGLMRSRLCLRRSVHTSTVAYWFAKEMTAHGNAAIGALGRSGLICRSAYEACQQNHHHCPKRRRSNTVRGPTSEAQIDPKVLQQSAANERTD